MTIRRVDPDEALRLLREEGYSYLDVRSIPEFDDGHPEGAFNVPLLHMTPAGMQPNPDFVAVVEHAFPKDAKLVLGCKAGGRSLRAAELLAQHGYLNLIDQRAGWAGQTDPFGRVAEPGWGPKGLPASTTTTPGHGYESLSRRALSR